LFYGDKELNQSVIGAVSEDASNTSTTNRHQDTALVWQSTNDVGVIDQKVKVNKMQKGLIQLERTLNDDNAQAWLFFIVLGNKFDTTANLKGNFNRGLLGGFQNG